MERKVRCHVEGLWKSAQDRVEWTAARRSRELRKSDLRSPVSEVKSTERVEPGFPGSDFAARLPWHPSPFAGPKLRTASQPKLKPPKGGNYGPNHKYDKSSNCGKT